MFLCSLQKVSGFPMVGTIGNKAKNFGSDATDTNGLFGGRFFWSLSGQIQPWFDACV
jgi:hypothetical protein